jgi:GSCFA family
LINDLFVSYTIIMQYTIPFTIPDFATQIAYPDRIMLAGSCFTEHISKHLADRKFDVFQNAHGILFNPVSVCASLRDVMRGQVYDESNLFSLNQMWHSWMHHSKFSGITQQEALNKMNTSLQAAHQFLKTSNWLIITLGSAFAYRHNDLDMHVSNNHRAPGNWFTRELLDIEFIKAQLQRTIDDLKTMNSGLQVVFTVSPVRHIREGVIDNNKSKARLIEAVHAMVENNKQCYYFPSYEIVIDELRDYRFYDIDLVHPNFSATTYVWQRFAEVAIQTNCHELMQELFQIKIAMAHRSMHPASEAHQSFLQAQIMKCKTLQNKYSFLNLQTEIDFFSTS